MVLESVLKSFVQELFDKRNEVENQDVDAYVEAKLNEIRPKIKAEAEQSKAYELKVLDIQIDTLNVAMSRVAEAHTLTEEATMEDFSSVEPVMENQY